MAKDRDEDWRERKRRRDEEDEAESGAVPQGREEISGASSEKVDELLLRADPIIDQVHGLYNQYLAGVESRPPIERRKQLDQLMASLLLMHKPTAGLQFRFQTVQSKYATYRDRWDRLMADLESGKLKRVGKPGR